MRDQTTTSTRLLPKDKEFDRLATKARLEAVLNGKISEGTKEKLRKMTMCSNCKYSFNYRERWFKDDVTGKSPGFYKYGGPNQTGCRKEGCKEFMVVTIYITKDFSAAEVACFQFEQKED